MIDLVELRARIAANAEKGIHVAPVVLELIEELEHARAERALVVAWLRRRAEQLMADDSAIITAHVVRYFAIGIERGEHRREEE